MDEPAAVEVESVGRDENTVLKLRVAPQDVGKVIGKQGRTARSVRTILGAVSMKLHHRYTLDILEEDDEVTKFGWEEAREAGVTNFGEARGSGWRVSGVPRDAKVKFSPKS